MHSAFACSRDCDRMLHLQQTQQKLMSYVNLWWLKDDTSESNTSDCRKLLNRCVSLLLGFPQSSNMSLLLSHKDLLPHYTQQTWKIWWQSCSLLWFSPPMQVLFWKPRRPFRSPKIQTNSGFTHWRHLVTSHSRVGEWDCASHRVWPVYLHVPAGLWSCSRG